MQPLESRSSMPHWPDMFVFDDARDAVKVRLAVRVNQSQSALSFSV